MNIVKRIYWKLSREICKPSDQQYLIKQFELYVGYKPNIKNPKSYLEKLLWLKLNWRSVSVLPSYYEGLSMSVIESMAMVYLLLQQTFLPCEKY